MKKLLLSILLFTGLSFSQQSVETVKIMWEPSTATEIDTVTLALWLSSDVGVSRTDSHITKWTDRSQYATEFINNSYRPHYRTNIQNGKQGVYFMNSFPNYSFLYTLDIPAIQNVGINQDFTFTLVLRNTNEGRNLQGIFSGSFNDGMTWGRPKIETPYGTGGLFTYRNSDMTQASSYTTPLDTTFIITIKRTNNRHTLYVNGNLIPSSNNSYNNSWANSVWVFGFGAVDAHNPSPPTKSNYEFTGYLFEAILYKKALNDNQMATLVTYLKTKWDIK